MTSEQELNEKLARWAGFTHHEYRIFESEYTNTRIDDPCWEYPNGRDSYKVPNFTTDLNACFKWLVPELQKTGELFDITITPTPRSGLIWRVSTVSFGDYEQFTLAEALWEAIEQLIKEVSCQKE